MVFVCGDGGIVVNLGRIGVESWDVGWGVCVGLNGCD